MNLGRQLKRVKQQADHLFLRSDRTDVIGELKTPEDQLDDLRVLCEGYARSLEKCLHTHATPDEKKLRKVPEYQAAELLKEALTSLNPQVDEEQDLFRTLMGRVVELQQALGMNQLEFEDALEKQVLGPITHMVKDDFPAIGKQKRLLKQVGLDVDAAKTRLRSAAANPGPNAKLDLYREELEEAEARLDQTRDNYACDIFSLLAREREASQLVCSYISLQRDHLQRALDKLDLVLPDVKSHLDNSLLSPVYGVPLHDHLRISQQKVAVVVSICVRRLVEVGLYEEGLLRVAGSALKVRRLKAAFDAGLVTPERLAAAEEYDAHVVAGALKCYLRELPEPLLTHLLHGEWLEAVRRPDHHQRLRALWVVAQRLPGAHLQNLAFLVKFLALVAANAAHNKMTAANLATVVAPNLLWDAREDSGSGDDAAALGRSVSLAADHRQVVEHLVEYSDYFFKEAVDLGATPPPPPSPLAPRTHPEPNGALPLPQTRPAPPTHRRNVSADLTAPATIPDPGDSPKQPQRTKKKQAPRPPQARPFSTHGSLGHNGQETASTHTSAHTSDSPEGTRSNTPPRDAPTPATRLTHTNSLRRPTAEPPKPPAAPAKPPRPSPPLTDALAPAPAPPRAPLGFEQMHVPRETDSAEEDDVVIRGTAGDEPRHEPGHEPGHIGFIVDGGSGGGSVASFRKSLENVLQQQAAGQPLTLPRHAHAHAPEGETGPPPRPAAPPAVMPPTPAQRTTIPTAVPAVSAARGPESKAEKPAIREKPSIASRPQDHPPSATSTLPRPHVPERPSPAPPTAQQQQRGVSTFAAPPPPSYQLPPPAAPEQQATTTTTATTAAVTATVVEEKEETLAGGGGTGEKMEATVIHVGGKDDTVTITYPTLPSPSPPEPTPASVPTPASAPTPAPAPACPALRPGKPAKPEKPSVLPRPVSLSPEALEVLRIPSPGGTGPAPRPNSSGSMGGSGRFCWPPPQPADSPSPTTPPATTPTTTSTTTTATATDTTTTAAGEDSEVSLSTADSTKL